MIIFGADGLGKLALEIFQSNGVVVYGFLDDDDSLHGTLIDEISILGSTDDQEFLKLIGKKCQAFVAESDKTAKQSLVAMLKDKRKSMPLNAIHSTAYLSKSSSMGHGNLISGGVLVNAHVKLGNHGILHAHATIDYGAVINDFIEVGSGCTIGPEVTVGDGVFIGPGATLISGITIGKNARIGAGSVVIADVEENETVFGNPAEEVSVK